MPQRALEQLKVTERLIALSNVVLLSGRSAAGSQQLLEQKIHERVDKEFQEQEGDTHDILEGIKQENLRFVERDIKQQNDGEFFVKIKRNVREKDVHLFHKFNDKNLDLVELLVIGDALKRAGVKSVTAYVPYIPYQRQDKKDDGRVPISAKMVFNLFSASMGSQLKRIVTFDLHARQAQAHYEGPLDELSAIPEFAAHYRGLFREEFDKPRPDVVVISPDAGGAKRAQKLSTLLPGVQYSVLDKKRTDHGKAEHQFYLPIDVKGRKVILVDDMVDSGSSVVGEYENDKDGPVQYLQSRGADVHLCATHAILSRKNDIAAEERLRRASVPVLFTNSLPEKYPGYYQENRDWMTTLSLDHALAKALFCNQVGESISEFLKKREENLLAEKLDYIG